jgi:hypothetical protein
VKLPDQAPVRATTLASSFIVNSQQYANAVYPIDPVNPTKNVTEMHTETKLVPYTEKEKQLDSTIVIIFGSLAGVSLIIAIVCIVICSRDPKSALDRNNEMSNGLIQEHTTQDGTMQGIGDTMVEN